MRWIPLIVALILCGCVSQLQPVDLKERLWRYDLRYALEVTLSAEEVAKVSKLAEELRGGDIIESAYNILRWEEENIDYDEARAAEPPPEIVIYYRGDVPVDVVVTGSEQYRTPSEILSYRSGVCRDYAILTAALLLAMNYSPVYVFYVDFAGTDIDHVTAAVSIGGVYFILDQKPPIYTLRHYYDHWLEKGVKISRVEVYEVGEGVRLLGNISWEEIVNCKPFAGCYEVKPSDLRRISADLCAELQKLGLHWDSTIGEVLYGYSGGLLWKMKLSYHPLLHDVFIREVLSSLGDKLGNAKAFNIEAMADGGVVEVKVFLAW
ncbi:MAG: transglutaminase-like domain-containing protein [Archaeoglobaceae archaeon]